MDAFFTDRGDGTVDLSTEYVDLVSEDLGSDVLYLGSLWYVSIGGDGSVTMSVVPRDIQISTVSILDSVWHICHLLQCWSAIVVEDVMLSISKEYLHVAIDGPHARSLALGQIQMSVDGGTTWHAADMYDITPTSDKYPRAAITKTCAVVGLLVGPGTPVGQLPLSYADVRIQMTDSPEAPVLDAGSIKVTE